MKSKSSPKDLLRFLTAGSVDDGKSTLIGRLLYDSNNILDDHLLALKKDSQKRSGIQNNIDLSFVVDGLKEEREQGITIDVAYRYFETSKRKFIIADSPGHEQYTRNMATAASSASLVVLIVDAQKGITTQTKWHAFISSLLGIKHTALVVNKMDLVGFSKDRFEEIVNDYQKFSARLPVQDVHFFPISALWGDHVVEPSKNMNWYKGQTLLSFLENVYIASDRNLIDLRLPIQTVIRGGDGFRGYAGTLASGILREGEEVWVLPSEKKSRIKSIQWFNQNLSQAIPPQALCVTLTDEIDLGRGGMIVSTRNQPKKTKEFGGMVVALSSDVSLKPGDRFLFKHTHRFVYGHLKELQYKIDLETLSRSPSSSLNVNEIGRVLFEVNEPLFLDPYEKNRTTGSLIFIDPKTHQTLGAVMVIEREQTPTKLAQPPEKNLTRHQSILTPGERENFTQSKGGVIWLTGLPASGKSTLAYQIEKRLIESGKNSIVLDGDNLRHTISQDLGFTPEDRSRHMERVGHVAKILADAGVIAIVALVSPFAKDRAHVREIARPHPFFEIYLNTSLETCEKRDPRGLYRKARAGENPGFTGIDSPYEPPPKPELILDTSKQSIPDCLDKIISMIQFC